jgi:hypothetical protein
MLSNSTDASVVNNTGLRLRRLANVWYAKEFHDEYGINRGSGVNRQYQEQQGDITQLNANLSAGKLKALFLHLRARGKSVHALRSGHGGEFTSSEFEGWLEAQGIRHEFSPSYAHKSNGLIERFHGTIMPRLRAVVHEHQVPLRAVPYLFIGLTYCDGLTRKGCTQGCETLS